MHKSLLVIALVSLALASCSQKPIVKETVIDGPEPPTQPQSKQSWLWEYSGDKGPNSWASLNPEYGLCATGQKQSPINLRWQKPTGPNPLEVRYSEGDALISNTGYTYRVEFTPQSQILFKGEAYLLEKMEIRSPSEHYLSNHAMPLEIQFYHRSPNGLRQAIVSVFAVAGRQSPWFQNLADLAERTPKYKTSPSFRLDPGVIIPPLKTFYYYQGSLPHPPCLEGVEWIVLNTPIQLSVEQISQFRSKYNNNNRPLQKLNSRAVINY